MVFFIDRITPKHRARASDNCDIETIITVKLQGFHFGSFILRSCEIELILILFMGLQPYYIWKMKGQVS